MIRSIGRLMMVLGGAGCVTAVAWWMAFFYEMLGDNVKQASECFYMTTTECEIGNMVGSFLAELPPYDPVMLWASVGLAVVGLLIAVFAPH
jgi:hypothetical protein